LRRHQLLATGIAIAMLVGGAAAPGFADPSQSGRIKGSGRSANVAHFSVQVREDKPAKGRLDYTSSDGRIKIRCNGFDTYSRRMYIVAGPAAAMVTAEDCKLMGPRKNRTTVDVEAEFVDNSSFKRGAKDEANFTFTLPDGTVTDTGRILSGDITVQ
jgi:hypothetical protein